MTTMTVTGSAGPTQRLVDTRGRTILLTGTAHATIGPSDGFDPAGRPAPVTVQVFRTTPPTAAEREAERAEMGLGTSPADEARLDRQFARYGKGAYHVLARAGTGNWRAWVPADVRAAADQAADPAVAEAAARVYADLLAHHRGW